MDGMINIRKEKDFTSHDVVAKMRGILKMKKIGHTGTLDPQAEGVLPVALGAATKLCDMFSDRSKTYRAGIRLGIATDTEDMTGNITDSSEAWKELGNEEIIKAVESFKGDYDQIPPMYSALKLNGKKLYEYARKGVEIEREARHLTIYDIRVLSIELPLVYIEVSCSKGTYIRTLSKDIGEKLNLPACMDSLLRTRVGDFRLETAITLSELEKIRDENRLDEYIWPVEDNFKFLDAYIINPDAEKKLINGNPLPKALTELLYKANGECAILGDWNGCIRIYGTDKRFVGVYRLKAGEYYPEKLFFINNGGTR